MTRRQHLFALTAGLLGIGGHTGATTLSTPSPSPSPSPARTHLRVGPGRPLRTLTEAARQARPGSLVEVDAGDYRGDTAVWLHDNLVVRAVGGRVRLLAEGNVAEGKAIWVIRAHGMVVEGFDFEGAAASGRNGAGIRFERGSLRVQDCRFIGNEMGLLTSNDENSMLEVLNCEFAHNRRPDGHNHQLYVGSIRSLRVVGSYFHHAYIGHLLKSRAATSRILYNRLTDESGGEGSYEMDFSNGGIVHAIGNLVEQGPATQNQHMIAFGMEGYRWPRNALCLAHNTLVDRLPANGKFLRVQPGADHVLVVNNLLVAGGPLEPVAASDYRNNLRASLADFAQTDPYDFRLRSGSRLVGRADDPGEAEGMSLRPGYAYVHPRRTETLDAPAHNPGAMQRPAP